MSGGVGEKVSPQLSWAGVPEGTKSFAILMEDPGGRGGAGVHHWASHPGMGAVGIQSVGRATTTMNHSDIFRVGTKAAPKLK
jgi:phosphatidylethanolamine-binding protein